MKRASRHRLATAPWWVLALVSGIPFGAAMALWSITQGDVTFAVPAGVMSGILFGLFMGRYQARQNHRLLDGLTDVRLPAMLAALRSAGRGRAPDDDRIRAAALTLARRQQRLLLSTRKLGTFVFAGGAVGYSILAVTSSLWWIPAAVLFASMLPARWWSQRRLDRQIATLESSGPATRPHAC